MRITVPGTWLRFVSFRSWAPRFGAVVLLAALLTGQAHASDFDDAEAKYFSGDYVTATELAAAQVEAGIWNESWPRLLLRCQLARGRFDEARETYNAALKRYPTSLTLRLLGLEVLRQQNLPEKAAEARAQFILLLQGSSPRFASRDNLIAAGRFLSESGEDAKKILNLSYDRVRDTYPDFLEAYIATAELALSKGDFQVAAETLQAAERIGTDDPRVAYLLARAWQTSDPSKATEHLQRALKQNPRHAPSLLFQAEALIDREQYALADETIHQVLEVNPHDQSSWALLAVLAHLRGDYGVEALMRAAALSTWEDNPEVDHLIGTKLSQKYRFEEGAAYQRRALVADPQYTPASFQLAQDLLRMGYDDVGWRLAELVAEEDPYNVVAHNLVTLNDRVREFVLLRAPGINVRMESREAAVYGDDVLDLLSEARDVLCEKYDVEPQAPIVVEIFPEQKDFAIRTFGLPGGAGYLGVCFGRVITANSPASQGERPSNWRSVLWHEFCHVVTLEKTKNRMPRWLSEGISVYEERQRDPSWGESMSPQYREMLLSESLTPVSALSGAFLSPPSPIHLQFAYYESSLVVEFLIENHGTEALNAILVDLGDGLSINDALVRSVGSLNKLDQQFAEFARAHAEAFGVDADWSREGIPQDPTPTDLEKWMEEHPDNYWALLGLAEGMMTSGRIKEAKPPLERLRELGVATAGSGGPLERLVDVYRELGQTDEELETLRQVVAECSDALPALRRLIELAREQGQWDKVADYAEQFLAIHPLLPEGHAALAEALEQSEKRELTVRPLRALAAMDPVDPAGVEFRLARGLVAAEQPDEAKRHLLRALDQAPRYRDALRLLLELSEKPPVKVSSDPSPASPDATGNAVVDREAGETPGAEPKTTDEEVSDTSASEEAPDSGGAGDDEQTESQTAPGRT